MGPIPLETKRGIAQTSDQQPYPSKRGFRWVFPGQPEQVEDTRLTR